MKQSAENLYSEKLIESDEVCFYCGEPFKECDTIIPGDGVIVGEVDVEDFLSHYWHSGCIGDWIKDSMSL